MDNLDDFLGSQEPQVEEAVVETPEAPETPETVEPEAKEPEAEATPTVERDEKGRFKPKETMVPLTALHETRDELKALKAELEKLRQPQQPIEAPKAPDVFEDPEGFTGHITQTIEQRVWNATLNMSEAVAKRHYGVEAVEAARQWATEELPRNPTLLQQFHQQADPYGFLVDEHKRVSTLARISNDPAQIEAFIQWQEAQKAPQAAPAPAPTPVPETLADAQSARGSTAPLTVPSLDEILGRR